MREPLLWEELKARAEAQAKRPLMGNYQLPSVGDIAGAVRITSGASLDRIADSERGICVSAMCGLRDLDDVSFQSTLLLSPLWLTVILPSFRLCDQYRFGRSHCTKSILRKIKFDKRQS
jgi:hypothetical protein